LVELIVSIGIVVLVLSIVVVQQQSFNSAVILRSQAYEIALDIRQTQLAAISALNTDTGGTASFRTNLGIEFSDIAGGNANQQYTIFVDENDDGMRSLADTILTRGLIDTRFAVLNFVQSDGTAVSGSPNNNLAISFERPNYDAIFTLDGTTLTPSSGGVKIRVGPIGAAASDPCPTVREIEITTTGQIGVVECP
jgi:type II secretory pathway pseudopilin PulG